MILNIITHPNPNLRNKSHEINEDEILSSDFKELIKNLSQTMIKKDGIGLAAPQVNIAKRVIIVNSNNNAAVFINPKIIKKSFLKNKMEEGCLSIPGVYKKVKRYNSVTMQFQDLKAKKQKIKANKLLARILQHEIDHLDGVLFIDKIVK